MTASLQLDALDYRILNQLQRNNRLANQELADLVGTSAPTCLRRVRRLRDSGIIYADVAMVDPTAFGGVVALVEVTMERLGVDERRSFRALVSETDAISQCYVTSGHADYVLIVHVEDAVGLHRFITDILTNHPAVRSVSSLLVLDRPKFDCRLRFGVRETDERIRPG